MTPEQLNELAALKAALKQHIDEAERFGDVEVPLDVEIDTFIARARTMSPLACKIALAAIERLEQERDQADRENMWGRTAKNDLLFFLSLWKGGQP